jgi:CRISPR/Cas system-associated endonuclease/helicase Cas3
LKVHKPGTRTIVVVNTVKRACELFKAWNNANGDSPRKGKKVRKGPSAVQDAGIPAPPKPEIILLHSRFRPGDRKDAVERALKDPPTE